MNKSAIDVVMVTYNQEKYIEQAIESVLMQKTNFSFRLLIGEDCSTDNTGIICQDYAKKFPDKIKLILHDKNQGLLKNYKSIFDICSAKYIAILEGDDFWTDKRKLQTQIDFLENNPNVGLVHSDCDRLYESGKIKVKRFKGRISNGMIFDNLMLNNFITPATVVFRKKLYDKHIDIKGYIKKNFKTLDYPMWLDFAKHTSFFYHEKKFGMYRILNSSLSKSSNPKTQIEFYESTFSIQKYIIEKFQLGPDILKFCSNKYHADCLSLYVLSRNHSKVIEFKKKILLINNRSKILSLISNSIFLTELYVIITRFRKNEKYLK